jgi:hypothetical protein
MKQLFYFYGYRLKVIRWKNRKMPDIRSFEPTPSGFEEFSAFIAEHAPLNTLMLVDIIEEEFQSETMPHVTGKDRQALANKLLDKYYRNIVHRCFLPQGREKTGRKDDRVLLGALTNAKLIQPWLEVIRQNRIPLMGIQSVSTVGERLLPYFNQEKEPTLLVTQQLPWTLRQSFYDEGKLLFSRLIPTRTDSPEEYPPLVLSEIEQTLRYLQYKRLIQSSSPPNVIIITSSDYHKALEESIQQSESIDYPCYDVRQIANELGVHENLETSTTCDTLFSFVALKEKFFRNQYAQTEDLKTYRSTLIRSALWVMCAITLVLGICASGYLLVESTLAQQGTEEAQLHQRRFERLYREETDKLHKDLDSTEVMQQAVDAAVTLSRHNTLPPRHLLEVLGQHLNRFPAIELTHLKLRYDNGLQPDPSIDPFAEESELSLTEEETPPTITFPRPILEVDGYLSGLQQNYREQLHIVRQLVIALSNHPSISDVDLVDAPINIAPEAQLSGSSGISDKLMSAEPSRFSLKIRFIQGNKAPTDSEEEMQQ